MSSRKQFGIRWEDGTEISWPSREQALEALAGVTPNVKGVLIVRDVVVSAWRES